MIQVPILAQNDQAKQAIIDFFANYREIIVQHLNTFMGHDGSPVDAGIQVTEDGSVEIYQLAPDKGIVIGVVEGEEIPIQFVKYHDVATDSTYAVQEGDRIVVYVKKQENTPDMKIGAFKRLGDVISMAKDPKVKEQIAQSIKDNSAIKDAQAKQIAKGERRLAQMAVSKD